LEKLIQTISSWSVVIPFLIGLLIPLASKQKKLVWYICAVSLTPQLIQYVPPAKAYKYLFYNLYTLVEFFLMIRLFSSIGAIDRIRRIGLWVGFWVTLFILIFNYNPKKVFLSFLVIYDNICYILILMFFLYRNLDNDKQMFRGDILWITSGLIVYAPIATFSMANWGYTHQGDDNAFKITSRIINDLANIFLYVAYSIALLSADKNIITDARAHT
jgi:hypothetical protein